MPTTARTALALILAICLSALPALAQEQTAKMDLKLNPAKLKAGQAAELTLTVVVAEGFHINSNTPAQPELIPTEVAVTAPEGITPGKAVFPKTHTLKAAFSESPVEVFDGRFEIKVPLMAGKTAKPGKHEIGLHFSFQACDNQMCLMPEAVELKAVLEVVR
jgi:thiol:disulfide interchange protein DsbD